MKRILILGGGGMLGHKALQVFSEQVEAAATFRNIPEFMAKGAAYRNVRMFEGVDAWDMTSIKRVLVEFKPDVVLNCIGVIKQLDTAKQAKPCIYLNALFPHLVHDAAAEIGAKFVHISTDCVFDGRRGSYAEWDPPTAEDLYGRTKFLGEVTGENALTLRTSIIGHELGSHVSLVDWFLAQPGPTVKGYQKAIYTGFPTVVFCRELKRVLDRFPDLHGLYQISSDKISKFDLLAILQRVYGHPVSLVPDDSVNIDRSLDSTRYRAVTDFIPVSWEEMIGEMHRDYLSTYPRKTSWS